MSRYLPLFCLALTHALVDAVANFIEPLWPELTRVYHLNEGELFLLLALVALAPNFSQILFGWLQDRYGSRYLLWLGPVVAGACLSLLGVSTSLTVLALILAAGYIGAGSFHPEAAVYCARLIPAERTRSLAIFMFGGTVGLGLGPIVSGHLVRHYGLASLAWLAIPAVLFVAAIHLASRRWAPAAAEVAKPVRRPQIRADRGAQIRLALWLLIVCSLRVVPNAGITKALAFMLEGRGYETHVIGNVQSLFLVCGSLGMLLIGSRCTPAWERRLMILTPLAAIPPLLGLSIPNLPIWLILALLAPSGLILIGTAPVMVSYAQHLFPNGAGMASALTMGISWGVSGLICAGLTSWTVTQTARPEWLFVAFIPCLLVSSAGALALPPSEALPLPAPQLAKSLPDAA